MNERPKLLDLFCGAGGAAMGYHRAGYDVTGVDYIYQPNFPFEFILEDVLNVLDEPSFLSSFNFIHASPPCQLWSLAQRIRDNDHPDYITPTRDVLITLGRPFVIENVVGAPLISPIELCGCMFDGLNVYRERLFEIHGFTVDQPLHEIHTQWITKMGRPPQPNERMHVVGNFSGVQKGREAMGIHWMTRNELREAIPPAYTEWLGGEYLTTLVPA